MSLFGILIYGRNKTAAFHSVYSALCCVGMAASVYHHAVMPLQSAGSDTSPGSHRLYGNVVLKFFPKGCNAGFGSLRMEYLSLGKRSSSAIQASTSQLSVPGPVSTPSKDSPSNTSSKSSKIPFCLIFSPNN